MCAGQRTLLVRAGASPKCTSSRNRFVFLPHELRSIPLLSTWVNKTLSPRTLWGLGFDVSGYLHWVSTERIGGPVADETREPFPSADRLAQSKSARSVVLGLVPAPDIPEKIATDLASELPELLGRRVDGG